MWKQIFKATFIAGSLDIIAACLQAWLTKSTVTPTIVLKYIASGVFGKEAFAGGTGMILFGLFMHFLIAFACTLVYFMIYPKLKLLHQNIFVSALLIAVVAWTITTRLIVPLSKITPPAFNFTKALIAVSILYLCIGLPISFFAKRFYSKREN
jgi:hypothetical protein